MGIIGENSVLVTPNYFNNPHKSIFFEYGYIVHNGNLTDPVTNKEYAAIALIHTNPNGSAPSTRGGDGSFMAAYFPLKPMYVLMIKKEDLSRSSISFIVGSENPYSNDNGYSGYTALHLDKELIINNLKKKVIAIL